MNRRSRLIPWLFTAAMASALGPAVAGAASLTASPSPCPVAFGQSFCSTVITWDATTVPQGQIWVSSDGGAPQLFACGNSGANSAPWIQANHSYAFTLSQSLDCSPATRGSPLASVVVTGVVAPPVFTMPGSANGIVGQNFSFTVSALGATGYSASDVPPGLKLVTSQGTSIQGAPTAPGAFTTTVFASNQGGTTSKKVLFTFTLPPSPVITSPGAASGQIGTVCSYQITATQNPTTFGASGLPAGLSVNPGTGQISGIPTAHGNFSVTLYASNVGGIGQKPLNLTINNIPPVIKSDGFLNGIAGQFVSYQIIASNNPTSFSAANLPFGLTLNSASGLISGVVPINGIWIATIGASNSAGTATRTLGISILPPPPVIAGPAEAAGTVGVPFGVLMQANNPGDWSATGLAPGLGISAISGYISGTPTTAGNFAATVKTVSASGSAAAIVTLRINASVQPQPPAADPQGLSTALNTPKAVTLTGSDSNDLPLTYSITAQPAHGSLSGTAPNVTYTPLFDFTGSDSFAFKVNNGSFDSPPATVSITVIAPSAPPKPSAPTAIPQSVGTSFRTARALTLSGLDSNPLPLTYAITAFPAHGSLSGTTPNVIYTPLFDYTGSDSFAFKVNNGFLDSPSATVTISVAPPGAPVANAQSVSTAFRTAKAVILTGSDSNQLALTYAITANPAHGSLTGAAPNLTYTPHSNYAGLDSFSFKTNNGSLESPAAVVSITVSLPSAPTAISQSVTTAFQTAKAVNLSGIDQNNLPLTYSVTANPAHGTLSGSAPTVTYAPHSGYAGNDSFAFKVSNGFVDSPSAAVTITVQGGAPSARLSIGTLSASPGDHVRIPIHFKAGPNPISGLQFDLTLPAGILEAFATAGPAATAAQKSVQTGLAGTTFGVIVLGFNSASILDGDVVYIDVHLSPSASGALPLHLSNLVASDPAANPVPLAVTDGSILASKTALPVAPSLRLSDVVPVNGSLTATYPTVAAVTFDWSLTRRSEAAAASANRTTAPAGSTLIFSKQGPVLPLAPLGMSPGRYLIAVEAVDAHGNHSNPAQQEITLVPSDFGTVRVFPNPWRADRPASSITFDGLPVNSTVKIFTVSGHCLRTLPAPAGSVPWDLRNDAGDAAASGLYIYLITDNQGRPARGKLAIIR